MPVPTQLPAAAAAVLLLASAAAELSLAHALGHSGGSHWLSVNNDAAIARSAKRGRGSRTLVRREEAPDLLPKDIDELPGQNLAASQASSFSQDASSPSPSVPDAPSPSPLMLPGAFSKPSEEEAPDAGSGRLLPLGHSDMIYAVGSDDKAIYAQRASTMSPESNWTQVAAGKVLSVATEGDYLYVVKGDGRIYMQSLSAVTPDSSWGQPLSRGNARTLAVTHDQVYAILEDRMLYKQDLPLDANHIQDWELASQVPPDKDGRAVLVQGDTIYLVKEDLKVYRQPIDSMTQGSMWIPTSQAGVSSVAIVRDVFYGVFDADSRVHKEGASHVDMLTSWDHAHPCSARGVESITSPWVREWQRSQPDVLPAYKADHFRDPPGQEIASTVNVTVMSFDTAVSTTPSPLSLANDSMKDASPQLAGFPANGSSTGASGAATVSEFVVNKTYSETGSSAKGSLKKASGSSTRLVHTSLESKMLPLEGFPTNRSFTATSAPAVVNSSGWNKTYFNAGSSADGSSTGPALANTSSESNTPISIGSPASAASKRASGPVIVNSSSANKTYFKMGSSADGSSTTASGPALANPSSESKTYVSDGSSANGSSRGASGPAMVNTSVRNKTYFETGSSLNKTDQEQIEQDLQRIEQDIQRIERISTGSSANGSSTGAVGPVIVNSSSSNKTYFTMGSSANGSSRAASGPALANTSLNRKTHLSMVSSAQAEKKPTQEAAPAEEAPPTEEAHGSSTPDPAFASASPQSPLMASPANVSSPGASIPAMVNSAVGNSTYVSTGSSANRSSMGTSGQATVNSSMRNNTYHSTASSANASSIAASGPVTSRNKTYPSVGPPMNDLSKGLPDDLSRGFSGQALGNTSSENKTYLSMGSLSNDSSAENSSAESSSSGNLSSAEALNASSRGNSSSNSSAANDYFWSAANVSAPPPAPGPPVLPTSVIGCLKLEILQTVEEFMNSMHALAAVKEGIALASVCGTYSVDMLNNSMLNVSRMRHIGGRDRPMHALQLYFRIPVPVGLTGFQLIGIMANSSLTKVGARIRSSLHQHGVTDHVFVFGLTAEVNMTGATPPNPWLFPPVATRLSASGVDTGGSGIEITTTTTTGGFGSLKVKFANDPYNPDLDDPVEDADPTTTVLQSMWGPSPIPAELAPQEQQLVKGTLQFLSSNAEQVVKYRDAHRVVRQELATAADIAVDDVTATFGYTVKASALEAESKRGERRVRTPGYVDVEYSITIEPNHTAAGIKQALTAADHEEMAAHMEAGFLNMGLLNLKINVTGFTHEIRSMDLIGPRAPSLPKANLTDENATDSNMTIAIEDNETTAIEDNKTKETPTRARDDDGPYIVDDRNSSELEDSIIGMDSALPLEFPHVKSRTRSCSIIVSSTILLVIAAS